MVLGRLRPPAETSHEPPPAKIPATIVTGIPRRRQDDAVRHLLGHAGGRRIALIVNEFGELGIDGETAARCGIQGCAEENIVELANGCICCTVAEDFVPQWRRCSAAIAPPEHIVIETSGLALPKPLIKAFDWPACARG